MNKIFLGSIISLFFLSSVSWAQSNPTAPASWIAYQQQESAKRKAFYEQMKADREAFLNANPDAKAYLEQMRAAGKARRNAWIAQHPKK